MNLPLVVLAACYANSEVTYSFVTVKRLCGNFRQQEKYCFDFAFGVGGCSSLACTVCGMFLPAGLSIRGSAAASETEVFFCCQLLRAFFLPGSFESDTECERAVLMVQPDIAGGSTCCPCTSLNNYYSAS